MRTDVLSEFMALQPGCTFYGPCDDRGWSSDGGWGKRRAGQQQDSERVEEELESSRRGHSEKKKGMVSSVYVAPRELVTGSR